MEGEALVPGWGESLVLYGRGLSRTVPRAALMIEREQSTVEKLELDE